jgi:pimeloyl-ACP methyl ester carboxylesterase
MMDRQTEPRTSVEPFILDVSQADLDDLRNRLAATRWPEKEPVSDWSQGAPLERVQALCEYWKDHYDWRRCEAQLNGWGQFHTEIDGLNLHFLHVRSPVADALPMVMTHGWPGSVIEFNKVIGPLTDPERYGGKASDAFHLILPSLPGFGFSDKPTETGWNLARIARAWITLVKRLGYGSFVAQGGDWGAMVTHEIALINPPECRAAHTNVSLAMPKDAPRDMTPDEAAAMVSQDDWNRWESGYAAVQSTRPQTIGYGLVDSPVLQAAWIYEKMHALMDGDGIPEHVVNLDEILDNIMLYWLPRNGASSARIYWESWGSVVDDFRDRSIDMPFGVTTFPREIMRPSRRWAEQIYSNIIHWGRAERGGHFAAFEQPEIFVAEVRECFRKIR